MRGRERRREGNRGARIGKERRGRRKGGREVGRGTTNRVIMPSSLGDEPGINQPSA